MSCSQGDILSEVVSSSRDNPRDVTCSNYTPRSQSCDAENKLSKSQKRKQLENPNDENILTPLRNNVDIVVRRKFTPGMHKHWNLICKLCNLPIYESEHKHLEYNCTGIEAHSAKISPKTSRKCLPTARKRRLFDIGEVFDSKD